MSLSRQRFAVVAAVLFAGCSNAYESELLKIAFQPPPGVKLIDETAGPPAKARFSDGIAITSVAAALPPIDAKTLEALLPQALALAKAPPMTGTIASATLGTLPLGQVVRFQTREGTQRQLIYLVPRSARFLMVSLTTGAGDDGKLEAHFERALASLTARD